MPALGQRELSLLEKCVYEGGSNWMKSGVFGTNRTVCNRRVGSIEAGIGWSLVSLGPIVLSVIGGVGIIEEEIG